MTENSKMSRRLISLDLLRGLTVMVMIFVNNGAGKEIFATLQHSKWNGMTLADCVFPFFLLMVGASTCLSLRKYHYEWSSEVARKIVKRTLCLILIGLFLNWMDMCFSGRPLDFAHLRVWGVMQRIGICYFFTAVMALSCRRKILPVALAGLVGYAVLLLTCGGYTYDATTNLLAQADRALFGWNHLYHKSPVDPEGLISNFSAVMQTMIGFWMMEKVVAKNSYQTRMKWLGIAGFLFLVAGLLLTTFMPLNKRVWSPSYVLTTCGLAMLVFDALIYLVDMSESSAVKRMALVKAFGMNPLLLYVASEILSSFVGAKGIKMDVYAVLHTFITNGYWASFAYAALFLAVLSALGLILYRKKIFVKI